jgi:hypothetical protein
MRTELALGFGLQTLAMNRAGGAILRGDLPFDLYIQGHAGNESGGCRAKFIGRGLPGPGARECAPKPAYLTPETSP